jgi:uncharacterized protein (DUF2236 family)
MSSKAAPSVLETGSRSSTPNQPVAAASAHAAGLFGPGSASWRVDREVVVLAGGTAALLLQLAHPAVAAGVAQHSRFQEDPFARLRRTLTASFSVVFGTTQRAQRALDRIDHVHGFVRGTVPETGDPYGARDPELLLWVHATLIDTALRVYDRFVAPLSPDEAEAYHREGREIAIRLGVPAAVAPASLTELRGWMQERIMTGDVRVTPTARRLGQSVLYPTRLPPKWIWDLAHMPSVSILPPPIRAGYGIIWNQSRERGVERLAVASRGVLPLLPRGLRYVPSALAAERRLRHAA